MFCQPHTQNTEHSNSSTYHILYHILYNEEDLLLVNVDVSFVLECRGTY